MSHASGMAVTRQAGDPLLVRLARADGNCNESIVAVRGLPRTFTETAGGCYRSPAQPSPAQPSPLLPSPPLADAKHELWLPSSCQG